MSDYEDPRPTAGTAYSDPCAVKDMAVTFGKLIEETGSQTTYNGVELKGYRSAIDVIEQEALSRSKTSSPITLTAGQLLVDIGGFNASLSSYWVVPIESDKSPFKLFPDEHYTYANTTTTEITLRRTFSAGDKIYAVSLDPTGTGVVRADTQFATAADMLLSDVTAGTLVTVVGLGNAQYLIKASGYTALTGDHTFTDGRVAALQPDAFGAFDVRAFGAVAGAGAQQVIFSNAATHAKEYAQAALSSNLRGSVTVPYGNWALSSATTESANWIVFGELQNPTNYSGNNQDNLSYLTGKVVKLFSRGSGLMQLGSTDVAWIQAIRNSILGTAQLQVVSPSGQPAGLFASRSSDNVGGNEGTIAAKFYAVNDNTDTKSVVYGSYFEAIKSDGAGTTLCGETNVTPYGTMVPILPHLEYGNAAGITANHLFGGPVGSGPFNDTQSKTMTSAAAYISGGTAYRTDDPTKKYGFDAGFVFLNAAFETSAEKEIIRAGNNMKLAWYGDGGTRTNWVYGATESDDGIWRVAIRNSTDASIRRYKFTPGNFSCDTQVNNGLPTAQWLNVYSVNAVTVTSDETKKTEKRDLTDDELAAGLELARNVQMFKWISEVSEKGSSSAYIHTSVMAQQAWKIMEDNNLDPTNYGFISNEDGNWSVAQSELAMLMNKALVTKQDELEARIASLENANV